MKILADESVDGPVVVWLREQGQDVRWIAEHAPGMKDHDVANLAVSEQRILLTLDRGFGEMVFRARFAPTGIILVRTRTQSAASFLEYFQRAWFQVESRIHGKFIVISPGRIRIRPL